MSVQTRLAAGGRRRTEQRLVVAEALASAKRALSAQELYERIRATHPSIGRATVYRALEAQVEDGMASRFEREGHISAYIACDPEHHHHLVCRLLLEKKKKEYDTARVVKAIAKC